MIPLIPVIAAVVTGGVIIVITRAAFKSTSLADKLPVGNLPRTASQMSLAGIMKYPTDDIGLVPVQLGNTTWMVAKDYIGPIGIGEAAELAKSLGYELPTPALVDAIWRQADLKLLPITRWPNVVSEATFDDQKQRISQQIAGRPYTLLGGAYKDIVQVGGYPQLYGWHVEDGKSVAGVPLHNPVTAGPGKIIQGPSGHAHDLNWADYSQGLRLVRKA
jgi:hypothetical protein